MSPEQAQGQEIDHRSDIWALGALLYEMVIAKHPSPGEYDQVVVYGMINEQQQPVTALRSGLPAELDRIIGKALAKPRALQAEVGEFFDGGGVEWKLRQALGLSQPRLVSVGIVHTQEERLFRRCEERLSLGGVFSQVLPLEVRGGERLEVEGESGLRVYVDLARNTGTVASVGEASNDVWSVVAVHPEAPGGQTQLAVLVNGEPSQETRSRRVTAGLWDEGAVKANAVGGKLVEVRRAGARVAVGSELKAVVLGDDEQDVRTGCQRRRAGEEGRNGQKALLGSLLRAHKAPRAGCERPRCLLCSPNRSDTATAPSASSRKAYPPEAKRMGQAPLWRGTSPILAPRCKAKGRGYSDVLRNDETQRARPRSATGTADQAGVHCGDRSPPKRRLCLRG